MRLSALQGFQLSLEPHRIRNETPLSDLDSGSIANSEDSDSPEKDYRLIAYTADQKSPIYISEKLNLTRNQPVTTNQISFVDSDFRRKFVIAVQLKCNNKLLDQWILDLRKATPQKNLKYMPSLCLITDDGLMTVPTCDIERNSPASTEFTPQDLQDDYINDSYVSALSIRPTISSVMADNMAKAPSLCCDFNTLDENEDPSDVPTVNGSLISRWLPSWVQGGSTDAKVDNSKSEHSLSLSYSVLVDLWTLQKILDEARYASEELCKQIDSALPRSAIPIKEKESQLHSKLQKIRRRLCAVHSETIKIKNNAAYTREKSQKSQDFLDNSIENGKTSLSICKENQDVRDKLTELGSAKLPAMIKNEQARLALEIMEIFPIEAMADGKFHFTIRGLVLPSVFAINHFDTTQVAAALGFVAQVVVCISQYLDIPLPYSITVCGSQSFISDNISLIKHGSVNFPLWTRGALLYRVEYALYLLHKDIDQLMSNLGLAVADLKQTLANLHNLLLVVSSRRTA